MENIFQNILLKVVFKVKNKPYSYLGAKSVSRLRCFLDGFAYGYSYPGTSNLFSGFQEYIEAKYSCVECISWNNILLDYAGDEERALNLFFEELEIFLKENNIEIPEIN